MLIGLLSTANNEPGHRLLCTGRVHQAGAVKDPKVDDLGANSSKGNTRKPTESAITEYFERDLVQAQECNS